MRQSTALLLSVFNVTLLEDCLGSRKQGSHDRALRAMDKLAAGLSSAEEICVDVPHRPIQPRS